VVQSSTAASDTRGGSKQRGLREVIQSSFGMMWKSGQSWGLTLNQVKLPRHVALREFPADLGGLLTSRPDHDPFLDHVNHVVRRDTVEKKQLVGLRGRQHFCAC